QEIRDPFLDPVLVPTVPTHHLPLPHLLELGVLEVERIGCRGGLAGFDGAGEEVGGEDLHGGYDREGEMDRIVKGWGDGICYELVRMVWGDESW
ncbi:MAG: hypothetical protein MMC33_003555, partial [Icmadophila ericetorum]|nr:hypothetical protein [Icmadophila ericetorum]